MVFVLLLSTHLSTRQLRTLIRLFVLEGPANRAAVGCRRQSPHGRAIENVIRRAVAQACKAEDRLDGKVEVNESCFGGVRNHLWGRAGQGKFVLFWLLKRGGLVYPRPVPNVMRAVLRQIIRQKVPRGSMIYSDGFRSYAGLLTNSYRHCLILYAQVFAHNHRRHINAIENFWSFVETKLRRHVRIRRATFCST